MLASVPVSEVAPSPPGDLLKLLIENTPGMSLDRVATETGVDDAYVRMVMNGVTRVTAEYAILLGKVFNCEPELWMSFQAAHDLYRARVRLQNEGRL